MVNPLIFRNTIRHAKRRRERDTSFVIRCIVRVRFFNYLTKFYSPFIKFPPPHHRDYHPPTIWIAPVCTHMVMGVGMEGPTMRRWQPLWEHGTVIGRVLSARLGATPALTSWGLQTPHCTPHVGSQVWESVGVATSRISMPWGGALVLPLLDGTMHTPMATGGWRGPAGGIGTRKQRAIYDLDWKGH